MAELRIPDHVRLAEDTSGRFILLNVRTGQWFLLNRTAARFLRALGAGKSVDSAVTAIVDAYPNVRESQIRQDTERLVTDLVRQGLLTLEIAATDTSGQVRMALPKRTATPRRLTDTIAATCALPIALALLRLPFGTCVYVITHIGRRTRREANFEEAQAAVAASHHAARWYPGRAACLEISLTAVIAAALRGCHLRWCLGTADDPRRFHAWVEAAGRIVPDPLSGYPEATYQRVLSI